MKSRIKHIVKGQRGFTLIELLVAVAITGVVIIGLSTAVFQLVAGNAKNQNHMTAVRQVQQVGHWMSQDMLMANFVYYTYDPDNPVDDPDTSGGTDVLIVYWTEYTEWNDEYKRSIKHKVTYNLTDDNRLIRHHYNNNLDPEGVGLPDYDPSGGWLHTDEWPDVSEFPVLVDTYQVAQYIDPGSFEITPSGSQYTLTVTATVGGFQEVSEIRTYDIERRPNA